MADLLSAYDQVFEDAGKAWNVDPLLLKSIAKQESGGRANLVGSSGEQGLMQIMPGTQKQLGVTDPFDPVQSIFGGAKYVAEGLDKEGTPEGALMYYNGGPGWRRNYEKVSRYMSAVASHYQTFKAQQAAQPPPSAPVTAQPTTPPTTSQAATENGR